MILPFLDETPVHIAWRRLGISLRIRKWVDIKS